MRTLKLLIVAGLILAITGMAGANSCDLFNDEDRATLNVRADGTNDYAPYTSASLYMELKQSVDSQWHSVSLPFAATNKDGTPFDVQRDLMESLRFYLVCNENRYNDLDDPHFQIDNVRLTKDAGGELVIDNFDDGVLRWSYQQHPGTDLQTVGVSLVDVATKGKVLDVAVTDMEAMAWGPNWEMNYIDVFTCVTDCAKDSFIYGDDWSTYDNLEFEWTVLDDGTRKPYMELYVRTDVIPEPLTMLGVFAGIAGLGGYIRKRRNA